MIFGSKHWETGNLGSWNIERGILWFVDKNLEKQESQVLEIEKKLSYDFWIKTLRDKKVGLLKYRRSYLMIFGSKHLETGN